MSHRTSMAFPPSESPEGSSDLSKVAQQFGPKLHSWLAELGLNMAMVATDPGLFFYCFCSYIINPTPVLGIGL